MAELELEGTETKRPMFGNRLLKDPTQVYKHNAWDNVEWDVEQEQLALGKVSENSASKVIPDDRDSYRISAPEPFFLQLKVKMRSLWLSLHPDGWYAKTEMQGIWSRGAFAYSIKFEEDAAGFWHSFYQQHQNRFFKDRHWLFTEFPELRGSGQTDSGKFCVFEVGCGAGNTVFPILQTNSDPHLFVYCCDFAESAVQIVKSHDLYDPNRCHAFQYDIGSHDQPLPFPPGSLDLVILIFVLSALQPDKFQSVLILLSQCLKPGGMLLFRDYGRYDMAQLRFKKGRCLSDNFYVRGDGTRVYFFTEDEVNMLFSSAGLQQEQLYTDRRLQVNRGRQVKMYRVWIQAKYRKPKHSVASGTLTTDDTGSVASGTLTTDDTGSVASGTLTTDDTGSVASGTLTTDDTGSVASGTSTTDDTGSVASGTLTTDDTGSVASGTLTTDDTGSVASGTLTTDDTGSVASGTLTTDDTGRVASGTLTTDVASGILTADDTESVASGTLTVTADDTESVASGILTQTTNAVSAGNKPV